MAVRHKAAEKLRSINPRPSTYYDNESADPAANPVFQTFDQQLVAFIASVKKRSTKQKGQNAGSESIDSKPYVLPRCIAVCQTSSKT